MVVKKEKGKEVELRHNGNSHFCNDLDTTDRKKILMCLLSMKERWRGWDLDISFPWVDIEVRPKQAD